MEPQITPISADCEAVLGSARILRAAFGILPNERAKLFAAGMARHTRWKRALPDHSLRSRRSGVRTQVVVEPA